MNEPTGADDELPDELPDEDDGWIDMGGYRVRKPAQPAATLPPAAPPPAAWGPAAPPPATAASAPNAWSTPAGWGVPTAAPGSRGPGTGTDGFAIASLVTGLLSPLGLLFGLIAKSRLKRSGQGGDGLATAGIALASAWLALYVFVIVIGIAVFVGDPDADPSNTAPTAALRVGECTARVAVGDVDEVNRVPCDRRHIGEVFAVFRVGGTAWPGLDVVVAKGRDGCTQRLAGYVGRQRAGSGVFDVIYVHPHEEGWRIGDRDIACILTASDGKSMMRSQKA